MSDIEVTEVHELPGMLLEVHGRRLRGDNSGEYDDLVAYGGAEIVHEYYPPDSFDENNQLKEGVTPRPMTPAEVGERARQLLVAAYPEPVESVRTAVDFE